MASRWLVIKGFSWNDYIFAKISSIVCGTFHHRRSNFILPVLSLIYIIEKGGGLIRGDWTFRAGGATITTHDISGRGWNRPNGY